MNFLAAAPGWLVVFLAALSAAAGSAPVPRPGPSPLDSGPRTKLTPIETALPEYKFLPPGYERRFHLDWQDQEEDSQLAPPFEVLCGPGDQVRVIAVNETRNGGDQVWRVWPGGGLDETSEALGKFTPLTHLRLSSNRKTAAFMNLDGGFVVDLKTGKSKAFPRPNFRSLEATQWTANADLTQFAVAVPVRNEYGLETDRHGLGLLNQDLKVAAGFQISRHAYLGALSPGGDWLLSWGSAPDSSFLNSGRLFESNGREIKFGKDEPVGEPGLYVNEARGEVSLITVFHTDINGKRVVRHRIHHFDSKTKQPKGAVVLPDDFGTGLGFTAQGSLFLYTRSYYEGASRDKVGVLQPYSGEKMPVRLPPLQPCDTEGRRYVEMNDGVVNIVQPEILVRKEPFFYLSSRLAQYFRDAESNDGYAAWKAIDRLRFAGVTKQDFAKRPSTTTSLTTEDKGLLGKAGLNLGNPAFAERDAASRRLSKLIDEVSHDDYVKFVLPPIVNALATTADAEVRARAEVLSGQKRPLTAQASSAIIEARVRILGDK